MSIKKKIVDLAVKGVEELGELGAKASERRAARSAGRAFRPRTLGQIMDTLPPEVRPNLSVPRSRPALPAPPKVLALPKPPSPLRVEDYEDAIDRADVELGGDAARAVTDFVGHEPETYRKGLGTGVGVMSSGRLERAFAENAAAEDLAVRQQLQQAFDPIRAALRGTYGGAVKLYRHQGPTSYFGEAPEARNVLSWTAQPEVAEAFAGLRDLPKSPDIVPEDVMRQAEEAMAQEGRATAGRWSFVRNPEYPEYVDLYRDGEHITDTDNVRQFLEGENEYAAARAAELEAERQRRMQNIVEAYVPLDDVVWATNRAGQHEFMVRNRPGAYYGIDKKGRLGGSEYKRGGLAVKRVRR